MCKMFAWLPIVLFFSVICELTSLTVRCRPSGSLGANIKVSMEYRDESENSVMRLTQDESGKYKIRRQRTFIRNPNYIRANKEINELSKNMYITELPLPFPGAQPGSSNGCEVTPL